METVAISMPIEHWGKVLDVVRQNKSDILKSSDYYEGPYREVLICEVGLLEEIIEMIKSELLN